MQENVKVLVSILNYNNSSDTIVTIRCFLQQTYANLTIQVVDNASSDGSIAAIQSAFPDIPVIAMPENLGYTGGNNRALERGVELGYDYILICNQDIEVGKDFVTNLVNTAVCHPNAAVVGGVEKNYYTNEISAAGGRGFNPVVARSRWRKELDSASALAECTDFVQGAAVLIAARAISAGLRFDPVLFMYLDEIDLGFQVRKLGFDVYLDTSGLIRHKCRPLKMNLLAGYLIQRNRVYLVAKHYRRSTLLSHLLYAAFLELPGKALLRIAQGHFRFAVACVHGFLDGIALSFGSKTLRYEATYIRHSEYLYSHGDLGSST